MTNRARLADVCEKITDGTHHSPKNGDTGTPYITAKNIRRFAFDLTNLTYVSEADHREIYARCDPRPGDVLYIKDGATMGIAAVNRLPYEFSMLSSVALIRPRPGALNPDYLAAWLNHPDTYRGVVEAQSGCAIQRMVLQQIRDMEVPLPPLTDQERIAAGLTASLAAVDGARRAAADRLAAAEALPAAYLREVFEGADAAGWDDCELRDLLRAPIRTGLSKPGRPDSGKRCLTLSAVRGRTLELWANKPAEVSDREAEGNWVLPGCFYVVRGNGNKELVGRGAFAPDPLPQPVLFPDLLFQLDLSESVDPGFFWCLWSCRPVRNEIEERARTAAGIYKINTANLNTLPLRLPSLGEQQRLGLACRRSWPRPTPSSPGVGRSWRRSMRCRPPSSARPSTGPTETPCPDPPSPPPAPPSRPASTPPSRAWIRPSGPSATSCAAGTWRRPSSTSPS